MRNIRFIAVIFIPFSNMCYFFYNAKREMIQSIANAFRHVPEGDL